MDRITFSLKIRGELPGHHGVDLQSGKAYKAAYKI